MVQPESSSPTRRLDELETVLQWEGQIDNARIRALFGVQKVWASRLLAELIERIGPRARRPQKHGPLLMAGVTNRKKASPERYLQLLSAAPGGLGSVESLIHDARVDLTAVSPSVFAAVRHAAQHAVGLQMVYRSMTSPNGAPRLVYPHAIVRAPRRWHMRAWCTVREEFRDFVLARIQSAEAIDAPIPQSAAVDVAWNTFVDLVLVPHPSLTPEQQDLIAAEYFPGARARRLRVRESLAGYVIQDLRVATDASMHRPPEYQLFLAGESTARGFNAAFD